MNDSTVKEGYHVMEVGTALCSILSILSNLRSSVDELGISYSTYKT